MLWGARIPKVKKYGLVVLFSGAVFVMVAGLLRCILILKVCIFSTPEYHEKFTDLVQNPNNATGGALSTFTSWGPTFEGDNKPQLGSPGGNILSTYPVAKGSYAVLSGTSMACPLVAGSLALIAQVRGTFDPAELENLLSANANPQLFNDGASFYEFLAPVQQQGGGLVQVLDAAYATVILSPSSLAVLRGGLLVLACSSTSSEYMLGL